MILFRKETEKILKDNGFSEDITVSRIDRHIWLVGECDKQIVQVSDLEVGNKLSKVERELLIEDYLYPNVIIQKTKINKLLALEEELKKLQEERKEIKNKYGVFIHINEFGEIKLGTSTLNILRDKDTSSEVDHIDRETYTHLPNGYKMIICESSDEAILEVLEFFQNKRPLRKKVLELFKKEKALQKEIEKIKKELKIIC